MQAMTPKERARSEWTRYVQQKHLKDIPLALALDPALPEGGYAVERDDHGVTVAAFDEEAMLRGTFAAMRLCSLHGEGMIGRRIAETPAFDLRLLWSWSRIGGSYRHAPYLNFRSLLNPDNMADPESSPEMMRFIRNMAKMGVNALAVTHELHHQEIEAFDQHGFRPYYPQLRAFSEYLLGWGIRLFLYTSSAPEKAFRAQVRDTDCCYDPDVEAFYLAFIDELMAEVPAAGGLLLAGGLGGYAGGSLYDCACEHCRGKSPIERIKHQIETASAALTKHGKQLVYTVTTDLPFTMDREMDAVLALCRDVSGNVVLSFKNCYHDFEELRYPEHPLFGRLQEAGIRGDLPLAVEYQLFPEMRGKGILLSSIAGVWARMFADTRDLGMRAAIGVIETHPDDAHPSMADWYAWGRLCFDPDLKEDQLLREWAALEYPAEAVDALVSVLEQSFYATGKLVYAKGVQCGSHGMIIPKPHFVRDIFNDTWCPAEKQPDGVIGSDLRQIWLYTEERRKQIESDPELELFVHARRVDEALTRRLLDEKAEAGHMYRQMAQEWIHAEGAFSPGDYRYAELRKMLRRNINDAERFYAYIELFLHWQSGTLKDGEIEAARAKYIGVGQDCSINTCDTLFDAFLTHLDLTVRGVPFDLFFESVYALPQYDGDLRLWQVQSLAN